MNIGADCGQAEILAGAIALGEADDTQRHAYREHLSICRRCLSTIGGEREIERVMSVVAEAREQEHWEPQPRSVFSRAQTRRPVLQWAAALAAAVVVAFVARQTYATRPVVVHSVAMPAKTSVSAEQEARVVAALGTQAGPRHEPHAESLAFNARAGAAQSVTVKVSFDAHGKPTHCTGAHPVGDPQLVSTLCNFVMRAR